MMMNISYWIGVIFLSLVCLSWNEPAILVIAYSYGPVVNTSHYSRTNFCARAKGMLQGKYNVTTALSGMSISTVVNYDTDSVYYLIDNTTGTVVGGLMYTIQQAIAEVGNFTFSYHMVADPAGKSGLSYMVSTLSKFDLLGVYYTDSVVRRAKGISFTQGIVDASLVLIGIDTTVDATYDFWNFLLPFTPTLWITLACLIVFNSLAHLFMENLHSKDEDSVSLSIFESFYHMWGAFTGGGSPEPTKYSSKLLNMGFYFVILILTASYTANMATFLISTPSSGTVFSSIDDAASQNAKICVLSGSSAQTTMKASYPTIQLVVDTTLKAASDLPKVFAKLQNGDCNGVVMARIDWQTQSKLITSNPYCNLVLIDSFREFAGAFPFLLDHTVYCTSIISAVFGAIIVSLKSTGELDTLIDDYLSEWGSIECAETVISDSTQLAVNNMAGVFFVYCMFVVFALIREVYDVYEHRKPKPVANFTTDDDDEDMIELSALAVPVATADKSDKAERGVLSIRVKHITGLKAKYVDRNIAIRLWTTSTAASKVLLRAKDCSVVDSKEGNLTCTANFYDCSCELAVESLAEEQIYVQLEKDSNKLPTVKTTSVVGMVSSSIAEISSSLHSDLTLSLSATSASAVVVGEVSLSVTVITATARASDPNAEVEQPIDLQSFRIIDASQSTKKLSEKSESRKNLQRRQISIPNDSSHHSSEAQRTDELATNALKADDVSSAAPVESARGEDDSGFELPVGVSSSLVMLSPSVSASATVSSPEPPSAEGSSAKQHVGASSNSGCYVS